MSFTQKEIDDLKALGFSPAAIEAAAKRKEREAKQDQDKSLLAEIGLTQEAVADLCDVNVFALSNTSDWAGFTLGSVSFPDLGVSVKVTVTATDAEVACPDLVNAILARKGEIEVARKAKKAGSRLSAAPRLTA